MDFDFLSSNLQRAYPFRDIISVARPSGSTDIVGLAAAIRVYTYDQRESELYLDEIDLQTSDGFSTLDSALLKLRWADDDSVVTFEHGISANAEIVVYGAWVVVTLRHATEDFVFCMVFPLDAAESNSSSSSSSPSSSSSSGPDLIFSFEKETDDIVILSSLVKQGPQKVQRIYVKRGTTLMQIAGPGEEFTIKPGFNVEISAGDTDDEDTGRKLTRVAINAVPGAGSGRYLICTANEYLRSINGVGPNDNGNVNLAPEECYWLDIPVASGPTPVANPENNISKIATLESNQLRMRNACGACCSCEDYIKTYDHLRAIWNRAREAAAEVSALRDSYVTLSAVVISKQPTNTILFLAQTNEDTLLVQVAAWNNSNETIEDSIDGTIAFELPTGASKSFQYSVISGSGITPNYERPNGVESDEVSITMAPGLDPMEVVYWSTSWTIDGIDAEASEEDKTITVTATLSGGLTETTTQDIIWEFPEE